MESRTTYIQSIQYNSTEFPEIIKSELEKASQEVAKYTTVSQQECLDFLYLSYHASKKEQSTLRQEDWVKFAIRHTLKLTLAFGSMIAAKSYISRYEKVIATKKYPAHN